MMKISHNIFLFIKAVVLVTLIYSCKTQREVALKTSNEKIDKKIQPNPKYKKFNFPDSLHVKKYINEYNNDIFWDEMTREFYERCNYQASWGIDKKLSNNIVDLIKAIDNASNEGLRPEEYNYYPIIITINKIQALSKTDTVFKPLIARLDILLTNSYLHYASDLLTGKINPYSSDMVWKIKPEGKDLVAYLEHALQSNSIDNSLDKLKPENTQYELLKNKLKQLRKVKENTESWPRVGFFDVKKEGDEADELIKVKEYLYATGYLSKASKSREFDDELKYAVIKFQKRHGIKPDGIIGPNTLQEMNVILDERIDQVKINLERLRWLPDNLGANYFEVNLPAYYLHYYENSKLEMGMKVIIGKVQHYTPLLMDTLEYLVFSPTWNVPRSISVNEFLPKLIGNENYLGQNNYLLLDGYGENADTLNPTTINWKEIEKDDFEYRIVQKPGSNNALGRVKFMFPNKFSIYMHDTPADYLFNGYERDFSHGCIRLEKPFELALKVLNAFGHGHYTMEDINKLTTQEKPKTIWLKEKVPVYFMYKTAWVDDNDELHFREDIYDFDKINISKLKSLSIPEVQLEKDL